MTAATLDPISLVESTPTIIDKAERQARSIDYRWMIGVDADGNRVHLGLHLAHSPRTKTLVATVNRYTVEPATPGVLSAETYWPMDFVRVAGDPCGRYSAKALRAFAAQAVESLRCAVEAGHDGIVRHCRPADAQ